MKSIAQRIAEELQVAERQVAAAVELIDGGATVPFIARYRKEATGALDDTQLRNLDERLRYLRELEDRRKAILEFGPRSRASSTPRLKRRSTEPTRRRCSKTSICRTSRSAAPRRRSPAKTDLSRSPRPCSPIPSAIRRRGGGLSQAARRSRRSRRRWRARAPS